MSNWDEFFDCCLPKYKHADLTRADVVAALSTYKELRPKFEDFTSNDGTTQKLISLDGTIPIQYKGSTYNIPIAIFLFDRHPDKPPIVYVRPTSTMRIKPNAFVDHTGLVTLPYISDWRHPDADLIGLLAVLQIVFGETPPVFSTTTTSKPSDPGALSDLSYTSLINTAANGYGTSAFISPPIGRGWQIHAHQMPMPQVPNYNSPFPQPQIPNSYYNAPGSNTPVSLSSSSAISGPERNLMGTLGEEHLRQSVLSAVIDQVRRVQRELLYQHQDELKALRQTQTELQLNGQTLKDMINRMNQEIKITNSSKEILQNRIVELTEDLRRLRNSESQFDIDEAVDTTTPLFRQLVHSFAEEQAIDDTIYYLGEAMTNNVIDSDTFLKKIRELSRKQFILRATIYKCREKAGLPNN